MTTITTVTMPRSTTEIDRLVQLRVAERDAWPGPGQPSASVFFNTMWKLRGSLSPVIPSQEELDRVFPVHQLDWDLIANPDSSLQVTWLGHAALLIQIDGFNVLTDPVFSDRASPTQLGGPLRYRPPPCTLDELVKRVKLDCVCISHNHYDHLCYNTVKFLAKENQNFELIVPLGLRDWFNRYVTNDHTIHELDWHESTTIQNVKVTSVPMKHWSNRVGDRDRTLWCGYVMESTKESSKFLFPGDTAWFDGLNEVGKQYGPFDMAAIPIGAYEPRDFMESNHINVEEAVAMKKAVQAAKAVPIHWGTFPLTIEPVMEPREKLMELMGDDESFKPWLIGETRHK